jgi:hypothetical protein
MLYQPRRPVCIHGHDTTACGRNPLTRRCNTCIKQADKSYRNRNREARRDAQRQDRELYRAVFGRSRKPGVT